MMATSVQHVRCGPLGMVRHPHSFGLKKRRIGQHDVNGLSESDATGGFIEQVGFKDLGSWREAVCDHIVGRQGGHRWIAFQQYRGDSVGLRQDRQRHGTSTSTGIEHVSPGLRPCKGC